MLLRVYVLARWSSPRQAVTTILCFLNAIRISPLLFEIHEWKQWICPCGAYDRRIFKHTADGQRNTAPNGVKQL